MAGLLLAGCLAALLFLSLLVADPALATLAAGFSPAPQPCTVVTSTARTGLSNCSWASCREGCTADPVHCHQIGVEYPGGRAPLLVTAKGCGYPPAVNCTAWVLQYGGLGTRLDCHPSRAGDLAVPTVDQAAALRTVLLSVLLPLALAAVSALLLLLLRSRRVAKLARTDSPSATQAGGEPALSIIQPPAPAAPPALARVAELSTPPPDSPYFTNFKRSADYFDIPRIPKKMRTEADTPRWSAETTKTVETVSTADSRERLVTEERRGEEEEEKRMEKTSWRRNTASLTWRALSTTQHT